MLMIILDQTIVNVALPTIQSDLGFSQSSLAWVVNAYLIAFGGLLLLAGRLGDLIGRTQIFLAGLAVFTLASLLCGAVAEPGDADRRALRAGRRRRADLRRDPRHDRDDVPRAARAGEGDRRSSASSPPPAPRSACWPAACSPRRINWHWIFFVNVPIGVAAAVLAVRLLEPERGIGLREGADVAGAVLVTGALMLGVYTIVDAPTTAGARRTRSARRARRLLAGFVARQATAEPAAAAAAHLPLAQRRRARTSSRC